MEEQLNTKKKFGEEAIYDARSLGRWRFFVLGFQHLFAMFGATVLVPLLTGLSISDTLLFAGLGTLLFHLISKNKVPAFLGSYSCFRLSGFWREKGYALLPPCCDRTDYYCDWLKPVEVRGRELRKQLGTCLNCHCSGYLL